MVLELWCHADVEPSAPVRHKNKRTCCNSLLRWSRFLWQLGILRCGEGDSVSARRVSFSHFLYLSQPAPPSSLTSTSPPRLWEDISWLQTYSLSGKLPHCVFLFVFCRACAYDHCVNLIPISPLQQRLRDRRLQADVCHARRRAGSVDKVHPEQRHGVQRLQAVSVRAGTSRVGAHVYRCELLEDVFESLAVAEGLRKCAFFFFFVTLKSDAGSKQRNHSLQGVLQHMTIRRLWL